MIAVRSRPPGPACPRSERGKNSLNQAHLISKSTACARALTVHARLESNISCHLMRGGGKAAY